MDIVADGGPAVRIPVRFQRAESSAGRRRDRVEELPGEAAQGKPALVAKGDQNDGGDSGLRERAMPPRYGPAEGGESPEVAYVDKLAGVQAIRQA
ncbi:hypothetical protein AB4089_03545 [Arthrobacter sp. 2MCAF15]|uniref:hypothetical protein n=1 Tax=Arthrobacter sp. 2MCAF15 TaxID=3232984 RepID=UPI003F8EF665